MTTTPATRFSSTITTIHRLELSIQRLFVQKPLILQLLLHLYNDNYIYTSNKVLSYKYFYNENYTSNNALSYKYLNNDNYTSNIVLS